MFDVSDSDLLDASRGVTGGSMASWNNRFGLRWFCSAVRFPS